MAQVTSVMTANPSCCREDTPLRDVAQLMIDHDCGMIPVVDANGRPVGAVTDRDIAVRIVARGKDASSSRAGDAMTSPVTTIDSATSLHAWCQSAMASYKVPEIRVVAALPMTATGKVKKNELEQQLQPRNGDEH